MVVLRVASLVVLSLWIGGLAALGFVAAPAIFTTLEAQDPAGGRALAGLLFGAVFSRFQTWTWILAASLIVLLGLRALLGPRPRRLGWRLWTVAGMLGLSLYTAFGLAPRIDQIRRETSGSISSRPDTDPLRQEFGRLHGLSNVLMLVTLLGGVGLLSIETTDSH
ncbi:MAG TPA: DUF4149 domain-containing protein [Vicinamibacterales bacterium]|nr:DUF4149 domain-containing protein [Vicinamibacterales bacterium]